MPSALPRFCKHCEAQLNPHGIDTLQLCDQSACCVIGDVHGSRPSQPALLPALTLVGIRTELESLQHRSLATHQIDSIAI